MTEPNAGMAELHVHLEGTLEPELLFRLAERNQVAIPWRSVDELRAAYRFDNLQSFLELYYQGCRVLRTEADFYELTSAYLAGAAAQGATRVEAFLGPQSFTERQVPMADILGGTLRAMRDAPLSAGLIVSAQRHRSERDAFDLLAAVLPWGEQLTGFGLGGAELGNPPAKFAGYYRELRRLGFHTTAHAGEEGPAAYVREALDVLGVERIDHGVRALEDPALVRDLVERRIPLTVCPISNLRLKVVERLTEHPLPRMLEAGLMVTLNSDDPAYFEAGLSDNYKLCASTFGLSAQTLSELAANSLAAAF